MEPLAPAPEHRLLVTVSGDIAALWGARFVGGFCSARTRFASPCGTWCPAGPRGGAGPDLDAEAARRDAELREEGAQALAQAAEVLTGLGFDPARIESKVFVSAGLQIEELLAEAGRGNFNAVVLGRRGLSWYETLFADKLSRDALLLSVATPVWVCREPEYDRTGVLLCLDGSAPSLRMAEHVGRVLVRESRHPVTLFRVLRRGESGLKSPGEILAEGRAALLAAGMAPARIGETTVFEEDVARAVLHRATEGRYAVVAVGCTGAGRGFHEGIFAGSVSRALLKHLRGASLWVSH
jgi:nucleotide-binding universal stress UspA family protein